MKYVRFPSLIGTFYLFLTLSVLSSCGNKVPEGIYSSGVSKELAEYRFDLITDIEYDLFFDIPKARSSDVTGSVSVEFVLLRKNVVLFDFKTDSESPFIGEASVNGEPFHPEISDEHIIIPTSLLKKGKNRIVLNFIAPDQSLNRRDDMLYTLLVPDRARTLFPCFDQPEVISYCLEYGQLTGFQDFQYLPEILRNNKRCSKVFRRQLVHYSN